MQRCNLAGFNLPGIFLHITSSKQRAKILVESVSSQGVRRQCTGCKSNLLRWNSNNPFSAHRRTQIIQTCYGNSNGKKSLDQAMWSENIFTQLNCPCPVSVTETFFFFFFFLLLLIYIPTKAAHEKQCGQHTYPHHGVPPTTAHCSHCPPV